jgi:hypothetical protein
VQYESNTHRTLTPASGILKAFVLSLYIYSKAQPRTASGLMVFHGTVGGDRTPLRCLLDKGASASFISSELAIARRLGLATRKLYACEDDRVSLARPCKSGGLWNRLLLCQRTLEPGGLGFNVAFLLALTLTMPHFFRGHNVFHVSVLKPYTQMDKRFPLRATLINLP